jgi:hypothetical protein
MQRGPASFTVSEPIFDGKDQALGRLSRYGCIAGGWDYVMSITCWVVDAVDGRYPFFPYPENKRIVFMWLRGGLRRKHGIIKGLFADIRK